MAVKVEQLARLGGHRWQVSCLEFSPSGTLLASGAWDKEVRLWDLSTLEAVVTLKDQHTCPVTAVAWFQPDGSLLATGSADFTTCIWNSTSGQLLSTLTEHFGWVLDVCFSGNGSLLATASWDKTVRVWDPATGVLLHTLNGHTKGVYSCHFHPVHTSAVLCTASDDETIRVWDARVNNKAIKVFVNGHDDGITCCQWSPDASMIASGSADRKITIWEPRESKPLCQLTGHEDTVKSLAFNPDASTNGFSLLASAGGCTARLWDPREGRVEQVALLTQHQPFREVEAVAVSPDGSLLATGARDNLVVLSTLGVPRSGVPRLLQVESFHEDELASNPVEQKLWRRYTSRMRMAAGVRKDGLDSAGEMLDEEDSDSTDEETSRKKAKKPNLNPVMKADVRSPHRSNLHEVKQQVTRSKPKPPKVSPLDPGKTTSDTVKERRLKRLQPKQLEEGHRLHFDDDELVMGTTIELAHDDIYCDATSSSPSDVALSALPPPPPPPLPPPPLEASVPEVHEDLTPLPPPPPPVGSGVPVDLPAPPVEEVLYANEATPPPVPPLSPERLAETTQRRLEGMESTSYHEVTASQTKVGAVHPSIKGSTSLPSETYEDIDVEGPRVTERLDAEDLYADVSPVQASPPLPATDTDLYATPDTAAGPVEDDDPLYARVASVRKK